MEASYHRVVNDLMMGEFPSVDELSDAKAWAGEELPETLRNCGFGGALVVASRM